MQTTLIKSTPLLRQLLKARLKQIGIRPIQAVKDANERGRDKITKSKLSVFLRYDNSPNSLKEEDVIWLCTRYCIDVKLNIAAKVYSESTALDNLKKIFGE